MRTPPFISIPQRHCFVHISVQSKHAIFVVCVKYFSQLTCLFFFRCDSCQTVENMLLAISMILIPKLNAIGHQTQ